MTAAAWLHPISLTLIPVLHDLLFVRLPSFFRNNSEGRPSVRGAVTHKNSASIEVVKY